MKGSAAKISRSDVAIRPIHHIAHATLSADVECIIPPTAADIVDLNLCAVPPTHGDVDPNGWCDSAMAGSLVWGTNASPIKK